MINTLEIKCPHCKKTFELFLSNNASMVILNCPLCATPLIYYKTRCFVLNNSQIDRIKKSRQDSTVLKILHSIEKEQPKYSHAAGQGADHRAMYGSQSSSFLPGSDYITRDDIINLRIELETCPDSQQFIDNM
ncbi:MAG TPA: hypothetical protein VLX68_14575 [Chitinivibrionales bacterium]|nr:hypothetical protein [Chitinivibrionales bacterium]